ncbi:M16 family metallopeptidase [Rhodoplanes serenus]|nr:pitrilysin family protein [Rhodoplanes serenus]
MIRSAVMSLAFAAALALLPAAAATAASPPAAPAAPASPGDSAGGALRPSEFTLPNGLQVVVVPDRRSPVVTHMVYYKVGSADEPPGKSGIAHFLEHLMFKGTEKNPSGRFSKMLATIGGQENAFTTSDYTGYFQRVPREYLGEVMAFEADRMTGLVLTDANVLPERDVVLEEYNMRVANSPDARMGEQVAAALYLNHPYGRPVIGWRGEIEKLDRADALAFYRTFYGPNNAVLVVTGDVDPAEVRRLAEATYGKLPARGDLTVRKRPQEPPPAAVRQVTLDDPRVAQPSLNRSYLVPSYATAKRGDAEALDVLAQILGSGPNSRLYQRLVVEKRIATGAGAWYQGSALDATRLGVYARPTPEVALPELEKATDAVIDEIITGGVAADELERAKTRMIADAVYAQDNQASMARWYGTALATGSTVQDVLSWPERVRAVTAEQVRDAARVWLDKRRSATGYLIKSPPTGEEKRS